MATRIIEVQDCGVLSDRSPQSRREESDLEEKVSRINQYIGLEERRLSELQTDKARLARQIALGTPGIRPDMVRECLRRIHETQDTIATFTEERLTMEKAIAGLHPTPEQAEARRALQSQFTELAKERFAKTEEVQDLLGQFRQALSERNGLAEKMREIAEALDCDILGDTLDEDRFESLQNVLPDDLLTESARWQTTLGLKEVKDAEPLGLNVALAVEPLA